MQTVTKKDFELQIAIAKRAVDLGLNLHKDFISLCMDIETAHNIEPLRLQELLEADNGNFTHDVIGIQQNLDRQTKTMKDFFVPRYTA